MKHLPKTLRTSICILGTLMILYWLSLTLMYGTISFAWVFLVGGICLLLFIGLDRYWLPYWMKLASGIRITCIILLGCLTLFFLGVEGRIWYMGNTSSDTYGDTILVLGAGLHKGNQISASLQYRLDKAMEVHEKTPNAYIIVSGGQGPDETISEAAAMKSYLVDHGIPEDLILMEDKSTTTSENMKFSRDLMMKHGITSNTISLITNDFHMQRAITYAQMSGFEVSRHPSAGLWTTQLCFYTREFFGVMRLWLLRY